MKKPHKKTQEAAQEDIPPVNTPKIEPWMKKAANEIDIKLGLPRFDMAIEWAAGIIAENYAEANPAPSPRKK